MLKSTVVGEPLCQKSKMLASYYYTIINVIITTVHEK